jgi:mono/diheme cytochrome c family protein
MSQLQHLFRLRTLPQTALALAACGIGSAALAQTGDPVMGAARYVQDVMGANCSNCHGSADFFRTSRFPTATEAQILSAINGAITSELGMMGYSTWTQPQRRDVAAYILTATPPPPAPPFAPPPGSTPPPPTAATPNASPNPVMFNSTQVGSTTTTIGVLFTNSGTMSVTFATPPVVAAVGAMSDFLVAPAPSGTTACVGGMVLMAGMSCSFGAQFAPTAAGTRAAVWNVNFTGGVGSRQLTLQGTATAASTPAPAPVPAPAPAPSAANAPSSGGGGAIGLLSLAGLLALTGVGGLRRRSPR